MADSHTTNGSLVLLFKHIFDRIDICSHMCHELNENLPSSTTRLCHYPGTRVKATVSFCNDEKVVPLEARLSTTAATRHSTWRPNNGRPASSRRDCRILYHYCIGHNPNVWGSDIEVFDPDRWMNGEKADASMIMTFGAGHRARIGRNMALISMWKVSTTLLRN
jgi:benzoate 4-monooxygenase